MTPIGSLEALFVRSGSRVLPFYPLCSRAKTVNENLKLAPALLSRFDLVFILLDKPDEILDQRLSEHVMSVSTGLFADVADATYPRDSVTDGVQSHFRGFNRQFDVASQPNQKEFQRVNQFPTQIGVVF